MRLFRRARWLGVKAHETGRCAVAGTLLRYCGLTRVASLLVLAWPLATQVGCSSLADAVADRVTDSIGQPQDDDDSGPDDSDGDGTSTSSIVLNSVRPNRGPIAGGTAVQIIGLGFTPGMRVLFGDVEAAPGLTETLNDTTIRTITPASAISGTVGVRVIAAANSGDLSGGGDGAPESAMLAAGFAYFAPVTLSQVAPVRGISRGGTVLTLQGAGLVRSTRVRFGSIPAADTVWLDDNHLSVTTPPLPRGLHTVTVSNLNGAAALPDGFVVYEPLELADLEPSVGPAEGNFELLVSGTGFTSPTRLWLGDEELAVVADPSEARLVALVPPGTRPEGAVDVRIETEQGAVQHPNAFVFLGRGNPSPRVVATIPEVSLVEGRQPVFVAVGALPALQPVARVLFGTNEATDCVVHPETTGLRCLTPAEVEPGPVDVVVQRTTDPDAPGLGAPVEARGLGRHEFIRLQVDALEPNQGSISGGTRVVMRGAGFAPNTKVWIGDALAPVVAVRDATELVFLTPPGSTGDAAVAVQRRGIVRQSDHTFDYYDPAMEPAWTWGTPAQGSIHITAFDGGSNEPVAGAFVMVGADHDSNTDASLAASGEEALERRSGHTDRRGQITLSSATLFGPQDIHVGKAGYASYSWLQVDATNVKVMLNPYPEPPPDPLPHCPENAGGLPALIRGKVKRIKDEYNTGRDKVVVTTTVVAPGIPLPDPGERAQLTHQGAYELWARSGELMVIAMAGEPNRQDDGLEVHAMGFRPFLFTESSSGQACDPNASASADPTTDASENDAVPCPPRETCLAARDSGACVRIYDNVDVVVDTPLDVAMPIQLKDAPFLTTGEIVGTLAPDSTGVDVWYDFGTMGLHQMADFVVPQAPQVWVNMPSTLPEALGPMPFRVQGGAYRAGFGGGRSTPWSETKSGDRYDPFETIVLEPLLPAHSGLHFTAPQTDIAPMAFSAPVRPQTDAPNAAAATANVHILYDSEVFQPCIEAFPMSRAVIRWIAAGPGRMTSFELPQFPTSAGNLQLAQGVYNWQAMATYQAGVSINNTDLATVMDWQSSALHVSRFTKP